MCTFHQIFLNDRTKADGRDLENSLKTWCICKQLLSEGLKRRERERERERERALLGT